MRFEIEESIAAPRDAVLKAVVDPRLYESMAFTADLGPPSVLECSDGPDTANLRIQYRFEGHLSRAARAILDPQKMTWVVEIGVDKKRYEATFRMVPDYYKDRMSCSGTYEFVDRGATTDQVMHGEMVVHVPLVAGAVERAILIGFRENMKQQAKATERFANGDQAGH